jgi:hypothetical protein
MEISLLSLGKDFNMLIAIRKILWDRHTCTIIPPGQVSGSALRLESKVSKIRAWMTCRSAGNLAQNMLPVSTLE